MTLTPSRLEELERVANAKNSVSWLSVLELITEIRRLQGEVERYQAALTWIAHHEDPVGQQVWEDASAALAGEDFREALGEKAS